MGERHGDFAPFRCCALLAALGLGLLTGGCNRKGLATADVDAGADGAAPVALPESTPEGEGAELAVAPPPPDGPRLGILSFVVNVYAEPRDTARKLGYLRAGTIVPRSEEPVGRSGCKGGWYEIKPHGFVCAGDDATTDLDNPLLKAAVKRPNLKTAMPYQYAFVRAVLPMYLRVPTAEEQYKAEFKLKEHLEWFSENKAEVQKVIMGANDVALDAHGLPVPGKNLGELGLAKNSTELPLGAILGGETDNDPIPSWLEGNKRAIPNISDYKTKGFELFADRARRHTGLALVGSFPTGPESLERRFAIMTDLRIVPTSKIKPDSGSPWHGTALSTESLTLPLAFIRAQAARSYKIIKGKVVPGDSLEYRSVIGLTGKMRTIEGTKYYRTTDKRWLSQMDVGLAVEPATFPEDAEKGKKWIEVSITNQTLVLWEGKKPVYATLVSTGRAGLDDPKKTTATVRGTFKIRNKHITATMDSNESSSVGGHANTTASDEASSDEPVRKVVKKASVESKSSKSSKKGSKGDSKSASKAKSSKGDNKGNRKGDKPKIVNGKVVLPEGYIPKKGDGIYGVYVRRGHGLYQLRDVPYIQYFESGYALHAAYWHDVFGTPRSHGCINLSPVDAHYIFFWTDPPVPDGWHAVISGDEMGEGTTVIIHE